MEVSRGRCSFEESLGLTAFRTRVYNVVKALNVVLVFAKQRKLKLVPTICAITSYTSLNVHVMINHDLWLALVSMFKTKEDHSKLIY